MPIVVECPACGRGYNLIDRLAGQRVRCKQCDGPIDVPDPSLTLWPPAAANRGDALPRPLAAPLPLSPPLSPLPARTKSSGQFPILIALAGIVGFVVVGAVVAVGLVAAGMLRSQVPEVAANARGSAPAPRAASASQREAAEALQKQVVAGFNELADALAKVSDVASVDAQAPIAAAAFGRIADANEKLSAIQLTPEERKQLDSIYQPRLMAATERYGAEVHRIWSSNQDVAAALSQKWGSKNVKQGGPLGHLFTAKPKSPTRPLRRFPTDLMTALNKDPKPLPPEQTVTIIVEGLPEGTADFVLDRLANVGALTMSGYQGNNTTCAYTIGPVSGVRDVLPVIDFGAVTGVDEAQRRISVHADASKLPKALPKAVYDSNDPAFYRQNLADLRQSVNKRRRRMAADLLAKAPPRELRSEIAAALLELTADSDDNTRKAALLALPVWADAGAALPKLIGFLGDTDQFFVDAVILSLGNFKDAAAVEPLMTVADRHRSAVAQALIAIGSSAEPLLIKFANDGSKEQQKIALRALGEVGGEQSLPVLIKFATSDDFFVRSAAEMSLEKIKKRNRRSGS